MIAKRIAWLASACIAAAGLFWWLQPPKLIPALDPTRTPQEVLSVPRSGESEVGGQASRIEIRSQAPVSVEGTASILDPRGRLLLGVFGTLEGRVWTSEGLEIKPFSIPVVDGRWTLDAIPGSEWHWLRAVVGSSVFRIECPTQIVPTEGRVDLILKRTEGPKLTIVDAQTGQSLDGLEVHLAHTLSDSAGIAPPAGSEPLPGLHSSPCTLPSGEGTDIFWIGKSGYAWARIAIVYTKAADRCVPLHRPASLELHLVDLPAQQPSEVLIRQFPAFADSSDANESSVVARLSANCASGSPWLRVELPEGDWDAQVVSAAASGYGSAPVAFSTRHGESQRIRLNCAALNVAEAPKIQLELFQDPDAPAVEYAYLLSEDLFLGKREVHLAVLAPQPNSLRASFRGVRPGRYFVVCLPMQSKDTVIVGPGALVQPSSIHVPAAVERDLVLGEGIPVIQQVLFAAADSGRFVPAILDSGGRRARVRSAAMEIDLLIYGVGSSIPEEHRVVVTDDGEPARVDGSPLPRIRVRIRHGEGLIPLRASWWRRVVFEPVDGSGRVLGCSVQTQGAALDGYEAEYLLSSGGRYRVLPPACELDFEPSSCLVECAPGSSVELEWTARPRGCATPPKWGPPKWGPPKWGPPK